MLPISIGESWYSKGGEKFPRTKGVHPLSILTFGISLVAPIRLAEAFGPCQGEDGQESLLLANICEAIERKFALKGARIAMREG